MAPISSVFIERNEKVRDTEFPALSVGQRGVTPQLEGVAKTQTESDRKLVRAGDLVINSRSDRRGASGMARQDGSVSLVYSVMTPKSEILIAEYAHHLLRSIAFQEEFFRWGVGIVDDLWSTNFTRMSRIRIPLPPLPTQRAIADELDQVEAMIAKLDKLAGRLKELQRANLAALGRKLVAPGERVRIGFLLTKQSRSALPDDGVVTAFRDGQVALRSRRREEGFTMSLSEAGYQGVEPGDFVFHGLDGFSGAVGTSEDRGKVSPVYHVCSATPLTSERFMAWALRAMAANGFLEAYSFSVRQRSVDFRNWATFAGLPITYISVGEQLRITDHLDEVTGSIDEMLTKVAKLRELLVERCSAFIADVMNGRKVVA
ncbi:MULTISPECIES: restriction endonuclease subunit S [Streptomyces]|nr:restriction endonuclease subunit S [Streptomyces fulvorobeus]NYE42134.1 type I restriction enzyme S subunit [Streptomyces fulvorobeus]